MTIDRESFMKRMTMRLRQFAHTSAAVLLGAFASLPASADDTEIYFSGSGTINANVLLVLDTSDSMNNIVAGTGLSRLANMRLAIDSLLTSLDNVNVGLMRFHGRRNTSTTCSAEELAAGGVQTLNAAGTNSECYFPSGGTVLFPVADLDAEVTDVPGEPAPTAENTIAIPIATANDDGEEDSDTNDVTLNDQVLEVTNRPGTTAITQSVTVKVAASLDDAAEASTGAITSNGEKITVTAANTVGLRFDNIDIPPGATINSAYLSFASRNANAGTVTLRIQGELAPDPNGFTSASNDITARADTTAVVSWVTPAWNTTDNYTAATTSTDIKTIIQEIVNQGGWNNNHALVLTLKRQAGTGTTANRVFASWDCNNTTCDNTAADLATGHAAPQLTINYTVPGTSEERQHVALRFDNVEVPQGATIVSAYVDFIAADPANNAGFVATDEVVRINAHDVDDSPVLTAAASNIGNRTSSANRTSASVDWTAPTMGAWTLDEKYTTPNLATVVQEVVDRGGWCGGNAMTILFRKSEDITRAAYAYDEDPSKAPVLRITYDRTGIGGGDTGCNTRTHVVQISNGNDDAEERDSNGAMTLGTDLNVANNGATGQKIGLVFFGVPVAPGATITSAIIEFTASANKSGATSLSITSEDSDNALRFTSTSNNITDRTESSVTAVSWSPGDLGTEDVVQTPDLTAHLQAIVDRAGWHYGNNAAFFIDGSGERQFYSYNTNILKSPRLRIQVAETADASTSLTVRERLRDINQNLLYTLNRTPSVETLYEAARYWRGEDLQYGWKRGNALLGTLPTGGTGSGAGTPSAANCAAAGITSPTGKCTNYVTDLWKTNVSHPGSLTADSRAIARDPAGCEFSNTTGCEQEHITAQATYQSPITLECQNNYMVFLTDGQPTQNPEAPGLIESLTGATCTTTSDWSTESQIHDSDGDGTFDTLDNSMGDNGKCGAELIDFLHTEDQSALTADQLITTYTIGFNLCDGEFVPSVNETGVQVCCNEGQDKAICPTSVTTDDTADAADGDTSVPSDGNVCDTAGTELAKDGSADSSTQTCCPSASVVRACPTGQTNSGAGNAVKWLKELAAAGGGSFFEARSASELTVVFQSIFEDVLSRSTSFVSPAIAANAFNRLFSRDEVYFGLFTPELTQKWDGNVKKYNICVDSTTGCALGDVLDANANAAIIQDAADPNDGQFKADSQSVWSDLVDGNATILGGSGGEMTDFNDRIIYSDATADGTAPVSGTALTTAGHKLTAANAAVAEVQAIRDRTCTDGAVGNTDCDNLLLWVLGKDLKDDDADTVLDETRWAFSDVLHSSPIVVTYGREDADDPASDIIDKVLVGTNDGALHMINGTTGVEEWAFMPQVVLGNQQNLYNDPEGNHIYGLDMTPTLRVIDNDGDGFIEPEDADGKRDKVYVYIGMRRGGNNYYALDITPASTLTSTDDIIEPKFLWRIDGGGGDFARLAETWSKPQSVNMSVNGDPTAVLIFAGGYDPSLEEGFGNVSPMPNPNSGNAIFVVNADTGDRILWISHDGSGADIEVPAMTYAIPSDVAVLDNDGNDLIDRLYVGDAGGQVWRVDFDGVRTTGAKAGDSLVGRLASISTPGTDSTGPHTDERRFFYPPSIVQVKDSVYSDASNGEYDYILLPTGNRGHPLDTSVTDRFYAFRDEQIGGMTEDANNLAADYPRVGGDPIGHVTAGDLIDVTDRVLLGAEGDDLAAIRASLGWFYEFDAGEKGLSAPVTIAGTVIFTSYLPETPAENPCENTALEGSGRAYNFDVLTTAAAYNWDGDDTTGGSDLADRSQELGAGIPSEVVPVFTAEGVTLLIGTGGGAENLGKVIDLPRYRTYWYEEG